MKSMLMVITLSCLFISSDPTRAQTWTPMPIVKPATLKAGYTPGGEGGQVIRALAISASDPDFLLMATDVGGIYRTLNGGARWEPCNVGWNTRGGNGFAIDPRNAGRALGIGGNSIDWAINGVGVNGLYLTTNKGASWKHVLPRADAHEGSLAYDPGSYDARRGFCAVAYFAGKTGGIWKTTDGGTTWANVNPALSGARLAVHPTRRVVYAASAGKEDAGFYRSTDGGRTFARVRTEPTHGLNVVSRAPDTVYISGPDKVLVSTDAGQTFRPLAANAAGLPDNTPIKNIQVSPANPRHLLCYTGNWAESTWYYSTDGGRQWAKSQWDNTHATLPYNRRDMVVAWHPKEARVVFGIGADWLTRSTDAGETFAWYGNGYNGIMLGGTFNFSPTSPDTVCLFFQDYNGAFTLDGGRTWNYRDVSGKGWGGYCYGGYAVDKDVMWGGDAPSWGGTRQLRVSRDGGTTWTVAQYAGKPITFSGPDAGYSDPRDPSVGFASNWRTTDRGKTWQPMSGCDAVFTSNPTGSLRELYGRKGSDIVRSTDHGATWATVATVTGKFHDLAYDHRRDRFYVASEDKLQMYEKDRWTTLPTPRDQYGNVRVSTVAVDPVDTSVVYAGGPANVYASHATIARSTDAGATWANLTVTTPLTAAKRDGPHEVACVRVHPRTREAWLNGQCFGMWKIGPPDADRPRAVVRPQ